MKIINTLKMDTENKQINVDRAWSALYARLEADNLLAGGNYRPVAFRRLMKYAAVLLVIVAGAAGVGLYLTADRYTPESLTLNNNESNTTLVTTLTDGSTVYLTKGASLTYPKDFTAFLREVSLEGDALFLVKGNRECPFVIETPEVVVKVTGTAFDIKTRPEGKNFELNVQEGTVEVTHKANGNRVTVSAGERIRLEKGRWNKSTRPEENLLDTYSQRMRFKDETLGNLLNAINQAGKHPLLAVAPEVAGRRITVTLANNTPEAVAELVCLALNLQQTVRQDTIYIAQP